MKFHFLTWYGSEKWNICYYIQPDDRPFMEAHWARVKPKALVLNYSLVFSVYHFK